MKLLAELICAFMVLSAGAGWTKGLGAAAAPTVAISDRLTRMYLPVGRGSEWSSAGYRERGTQGIPYPRPRWNVVKHFGAKGDGVTDNGPALQAALATASRTRGGGVLAFPPGTYLCSQPLVVNASNVVLRGAGMDKTKLMFTRSLSEAFNGKWIEDKCTGKLTSRWSSTGGMLTFSGTAARGIPRTLAKVTGVVPEGGVWIPVSTIGGLNPGMWVELVVNDGSTNWALRGVPEPSDCPAVNSNNTVSKSRSGVTVKPLTVSPQMLNNPAYRAAMGEGAFADAEPGEGISVEQAAAVDQAAAAAAARKVGGAVAVRTLMAEPGTVRAWVHGENLAYSGQYGAVNRNDVRLLFRIQAVDKLRLRIQSDRRLIIPVKANWTGLIRSYHPGIQDSGVESMTVGFRNASQYWGHFMEDGYNAIQFTGVSNCWARNLRILDVDYALSLANSEFNTLQNISIALTKPRYPPGDRQQRNGHTGIAMGLGQSNLLTGFNVEAKMWHEISGCCGGKLNVYCNGRGTDLNLDLHRAGPMWNLFSNINVGRGTRPFESGGRIDRGAHTGRGTTFYNWRTDAGTPVSLPKTCDYGPLLNFVGKFAFPLNQCNASGWKHWPMKRHFPADLYSGQVAARIALESAARAGA